MYLFIYLFVYLFIYIGHKSPAQGGVLAGMALLERMCIIKSPMLQIPADRSGSLGNIPPSTSQHVPRAMLSGADNETFVKESNSSGAHTRPHSPTSRTDRGAPRWSIGCRGKCPTGSSASESFCSSLVRRPRSVAPRLQNSQARRGRSRTSGPALHHGAGRSGRP